MLRFLKRAGRYPGYWTCPECGNIVIGTMIRCIKCQQMIPVIKGLQENEYERLRWHKKNIGG